MRNLNGERESWTLKPCRPSSRAERTDLDKSVNFYETVLGLEVTHRIETADFSEVVLSGDSGNRIQLARHHAQKGPIEHGNGFWRRVL